MYWIGDVRCGASKPRTFHYHPIRILRSANVCLIFMSWNLNFQIAWSCNDLHIASAFPAIKCTASNIKEKWWTRHWYARTISTTINVGKRVQISIHKQIFHWFDRIDLVKTAYNQDVLCCFLRLHCKYFAWFERFLAKC